MDSNIEEANGTVIKDNVDIKKEDIVQGNFDDNVSTQKIDISNVKIENTYDTFSNTSSEISKSFKDVSIKDNAKELKFTEIENKANFLVSEEEKLGALSIFKSFEEATKIRLSNNINGNDKKQALKIKENIAVKKELDEDSKNVDQKKAHIELRNMLEDIEEGELDYGEEDDGELNDEDDDLPDLPEYDPMVKELDKKIKEEEGEEGEILSDENEENVEREEGEILDDDETGQVYICVDPVNDKWKKVSKEEQKRLQELEEGQIDDPEEGEMVIPSPPPPPIMKPVGRFIPRTLCKYFNNGLCRWGATCRFLHPGINDDGIPVDMTPTWNATAGNYVMHRPPGMYPNAFGKAPSPMECVNIPVMPSPPVVDMGYMPHPEYMNVLPMGVMPPPNVHPVEMPPPQRKESAWEKGLRRAKEVKEAAIRKREEDEDFEEKRKSMRIPESREFDYEAGIEKRPELDLRDQEAKEYYERKYERKMEKYNAEKYYKKNQENEKNRQRIAELPPNHPLRREEQLRQREREKREKKEEKHREKENEQDYRNKQKVYENRIREEPTRPPMKNIGVTEWHDPWMRSQPQPLSQVKPEGISGVEAISNSDSSSSDSDSDSDSSSSDSDSDGSGSSSSGHEGKKKITNGKTHDERKRDRFGKKQEKTAPEFQRNKPEKVDSSYEEWKRQQALQKQASHTKTENRSSPRSNYSLKESLRKTREEEEPKRIEQETPFPKSISNTPGNKKLINQTTPFKLQFGSSALTVRSKPNPLKTELKPSSTSTPAPKNDDKFDSPKRKAKESDSDSDSESSDSDNSNSESSDSDSDDSDTESDSDNDVKAKLPPSLPTPAAKNFRAPPMDTNARKDIKLTLTEKLVKPEPPPVPGVGAKRPARKDELLKELKAVEDAIARKRAKID